MPSLNRYYYTIRLCKFCNKNINTKADSYNYENEICYRCEKKAILSICDKCKKIATIVKFYKDKKWYCEKCHPKFMGQSYVYP